MSYKGSPNAFKLPQDFFPMKCQTEKIKERELTLFYENCNIQPKRKPDESLKKINIASFLSQFAKKSKSKVGGVLFSTSMQCRKIT